MLLHVKTPTHERILVVQTGVTYYYTRSDPLWEGHSVLYVTGTGENHQRMFRDEEADLFFRMLCNLVDQMEVTT